jgi:acetyl esterase/lipase
MPGLPDTIAVKPVKLPAGYTALINTVYTTQGDWQGRMDLYVPGSAVNTPALAAVIINIHGGAWTHGNKESQGGFSAFLKKGFLVANVEYRMSPVAQAPASIQDVRCALLYLVKHAAELHIDLHKIVVMGSSAGGHLALMAGLLGASPRFDQNCPTTTNFKIAAIIDKYGPTDLSIISSLDHIKKSAYSWLGGHVNDPAFLRSISPLYYVKTQSPPVFIVHGDADPTVPYEQSVLLHDKLDKKGVKNKFLTIPGGHHGKFTPEENQQVSRQVMDFLVSCGITK